jgi:RNA polymerase sigma factor (sigma-70 family)
MRIRKSKVRSEISLADLELSDILDDKENVTQSIAHSEELEFLTQAIQSLPKRCRQIITLRKIYGMSQKAIANQLNISESTVETQGTLGMKKLSAYFRRHKIVR